jgi:hypothetical protein
MKRLIGVLNLICAFAFGFTEWSQWLAGLGHFARDCRQSMPDFANYSSILRNLDPGIRTKVAGCWFRLPDAPNNGYLSWSIIGILRPISCGAR